MQDALYSAVLDTRSTMLDTLRRVQWSPGTAPAVESLQERLDCEHIPDPPMDLECNTESIGNPIQMSHGMLVQAKELVKTLVDHVESLEPHNRPKNGVALSDDVQALQVLPSRGFSFLLSPCIENL